MTHDGPHPAARLSLPLLLGVVVLGLYFSSRFNPFMIDDNQAIVNHPDVGRAQGVLELWAHDYWAGQTEDRNLYRPVTVLSFWFNARLSEVLSYWITGTAQLKPITFRGVNMVLLWLVGWLLAWWFGRYSPHPMGPWLGAVLFVAHPVNAELINHIVGRADLLAMLGIVGFALAQRRAQIVGRWTPFVATAAAGFAVLAMGAKETGLLIVPVALLQGWCVKGAEKPADPAVRRRLRVKAMLLVGVPLAVYFIGRLCAVGFWPHYSPSVNDDLTGNPLRALTLSQRLPAALAIGWFYFKQLFWPDTGFSHVPASLPTWSSAVTWLGLLVLTALVLATIRAIRRRSWLSAPLVVALGQYLLVGNLLTPAGVYAANRLAGPFVLAAAALFTAWITRLTFDSTRRRAVAMLPTLAVMLLMGSSVQIVNARWLSTERVMAHDFYVHPINPIAMYHYGTALAEAGKNQQAVPLLRHAVERRPASIQARRNLAGALLLSGEVIAARNEYFDILRHHPDDLQAHIQIAALAMAQGDDALAEQHLEAARKLAPTDALVMYNLAELAVQRKAWTEALKRYEDLLREHPDHQQGRQRYNELREQLDQLDKK